MATQDERIADVEAELRDRDNELKRVRDERDKADARVAEMREHVEDLHATFDQWRDTFDMQRDADGAWVFNPRQSALWEARDGLWAKHQSLLRRWNKFVGEYNARVAPRIIGRPRAASDAQYAEVLRRRKAGESLRRIAGATGLGLQTVRTILKNRPQLRTNLLQREKPEKLAAAEFRARKRAFDALPGQITEFDRRGAALVKATKGLG